MSNFGQVAWGEEISNQYLSFKKDGDYNLRFLNDPYMYAVHWVVDAQGKTRKVNCAGKDCVLCKEVAAGLLPESCKAKTTYVVEVLNKDLNKCQILEFTKSVYVGIGILKKKKAWGDPRHYDIVVTKDKSAADPKLIYTVSPGGAKEPLTPEELQKVEDFLKTSNLAEIAEPSTNDVILRKLGRIESEVPPAQLASGASGAVAAVASAEDFNF
jgi:hypothetical protein